MKIVITGGAGFIGSNLANVLYKEHDVVVVDDLSFGVKENLVKEVKFIKADVSRCSKAFNKADIIFHFAGHSSAPMFNPNPIDVLPKNIKNFISVLTEAYHNNCRVIYASSSSVYSSVVDQREDANCIPNSFYEINKLTLENIARIYWRDWNVRSLGMRYFSVYGQNERHKGKCANLVTHFIKNIRDGIKPNVYNDGKHSRDFIYIKDVTDANISAMYSYNWNCDILNIGTGLSTTLNELIMLINDILGTDVMPSFIDTDMNYVKHTKANTEKAEKVIEFKAKWNLKDGIRDYCYEGVD